MLGLVDYGSSGSGSGENDDRGKDRTTLSGLRPPKKGGLGLPAPKKGGLGLPPPRKGGLGLPPPTSEKTDMPKTDERQDGLESQTYSTALQSASVDGARQRKKRKKTFNLAAHIASIAPEKDRSSDDEEEKGTTTEETGEPALKKQKTVEKKTGLAALLPKPQHGVTPVERTGADAKRKAEAEAKRKANPNIIAVRGQGPTSRSGHMLPRKLMNTSAHAKPKPLPKKSEVAVHPGGEAEGDAAAMNALLNGGDDDSDSDDFDDIVIVEPEAGPALPYSNVGPSPYGDAAGPSPYPEVAGPTPYPEVAGPSPYPDVTGPSPYPEVAGPSPYPNVAVSPYPEVGAAPYAQYGGVPMYSQGAHSYGGVSYAPSPYHPDADEEAAVHNPMSSMKGGMSIRERQLLEQATGKGAAFHDVRQAKIINMGVPAALEPTTARPTTKKPKDHASKLARRRHQLSSLVADAQEYEEKMQMRDAQGQLTKAQTYGKYGW